jgi:hypothetical protein
MDFPKCYDTRPCFARRPRTIKDDTPVCNCLQSVYENEGERPFCKPLASVTNGKTYPRKVY